MHKSIALLLSFCLLLSNLSFAQLKPTADKTLVVYKIYNPDRQPYVDSEVLFIGKKGTKIKATTDKNGEVKALLPNNDSYTTQCGTMINDKAIVLRDLSYSVLGGSRNTFRYIDYTFEIHNYEGEAVANEKISIVSSSGKRYEKSTNNNGQARFYLPLGETYTLSLQYHPDYKTIDLPDKGQGITQTGYSMFWMGSVAQLADEQAYAASKRQFAEEMRIQDSITASKPTKVVFFASSSVSKRVGTITVYDGGKNGKKIGEVRAVWSCQRGPVTKEKIEVQINKMKGTYRYYAISTEGVEWEGSYEVFGSGHKGIYLEIE